jgi:superfamily II DNA/RNA helicase
MLDMGFIPDIEEICTKLPKTRQTLLFSATMPPVIKKLADKFLNDPKRVEVARPASTNINITQRIVEVPGSAFAKRETLRALLREDDVTTAIIFCNRKTTVRELNKSLKKHGFRSAEIHGDMDQPARIAELDRFKAGDVNILVASDVAARGLDIKGVSHVYNFDAPWHPDDYVHRIGRTGRAGATGTAYTLVAPDDAENIAEIEKLTGQKIERVKLAGAAPTRDVESPKRETSSRRKPSRKTEAEPAPKREATPARETEIRREETPRRERGGRGRGREEGREQPRRQAQAQDEPDDGWNGPVPDFLNYTLGA